MQFNAKDDFVTEQQLRDEQEQLQEEIRATEEDNGFDKKKDITTMEFWEEQSFENERAGFVSAIDDYEEDL